MNNLENFHLDPQDFQNFLLINPPLTEYSNHFNNFNDSSSNPTTVQSTNGLSFDNNHNNTTNNTNLTDNTISNDLINDNVLPINNAASSLEIHELNNLFHSGNGNGNNNNGSSSNQYITQNTASLLPTRRLSISNGQIGQISMMVHDSTNYTNNAITNSTADATTTGTTDTADSANNTTTISHNGNNGSNSSNDNQGIEVDNNGFPVHSLVYNNEIIFDASNGKQCIPGTNAWKKQKILERNRIAASKCRAKKKQVQRKLQRDNEELIKERKLIRDKLLFFCNNNTKGVTISDILGNSESCSGSGSGSDSVDINNFLNLKDL